MRIDFDRRALARPDALTRPSPFALRSSLFARLPGDNTVTDASGNTANIVKVVPVGNGAVILVDLVMLPSSE